MAPVSHILEPLSPLMITRQYLALVCWVSAILYTLHHEFSLIRNTSLCSVLIPRVMAALYSFIPIHAASISPYSQENIPLSHFCDSLISRISLILFSPHSQPFSLILAQSLYSCPSGFFNSCRLSLHPYVSLSLIPSLSISSSSFLYFSIFLFLSDISSFPFFLPCLLILVHFFLFLPFYLFSFCFVTSSFLYFSLFFSYLASYCIFILAHHLFIPVSFHSADYLFFPIVLSLLLIPSFPHMIPPNLSSHSYVSSYSCTLLPHISLYFSFPCNTSLSYLSLNFSFLASYLLVCLQCLFIPSLKSLFIPLPIPLRLTKTLALYFSLFLHIYPPPPHTHTIFTHAHSFSHSCTLYPFYSSIFSFLLVQSLVSLISSFLPIPSCLLIFSPSPNTYSSLPLFLHIHS